MLLFSVYMPTDQRHDGVNVSTVQDVLSEISAICHTCGSDYIVVMGDLNTDFTRDTPQKAEINHFCQVEMLHPCVYSSVSNVEYTFENSAGARSLIDHCIISHNLMDSLKCFNDYDTINNSSDHLPIFAQFKIKCSYVKAESRPSVKSVSWYKATIDDVNKYKECIDNSLKNVVLPEDALSCNDLECTLHRSTLEELYYTLIYDVCVKSGYEALPKRGQGKTYVRAVPGWSEYVAHKKDLALRYHWLWKDAGRSSSGPLFDMRRKARADYHLSVRRVKLKENVIKSRKMATALLEKDGCNFWREVRSVKKQTKNYHLQWMI